MIVGEHVAQARFDQRLADLVLDRGDRLGAEMVAVGGVLALPEGAHVGIADVMVDELYAEWLVDQEAGEHQQCAAGDIEQRAYCVGQDVIEPRPPALRPDVAEGGDDAIGYDRFEIIGQHQGGRIGHDRRLSSL